MNRLRLIIEILLVACIVVLAILLARSKNQTPNNSGELSERIIQRLQKDLASYEQTISDLKDDNELIQNKVDSLEAAKSKIKYIYIERIKKIDGLTTDETADEFKHLFETNVIE